MRQILKDGFGYTEYSYRKYLLGLVSLSMDCGTVVKMNHFTRSTIVESIHVSLIYFKNIHYFNHSRIYL